MKRKRSSSETFAGSMQTKEERAVFEHLGVPVGCQIEKQLGFDLSSGIQDLDAHLADLIVRRAPLIDGALSAVKEQLNQVKRKLRAFDSDAWGKHTAMTSLGGLVSSFARKAAQPEMPTTAFFKMFEMLSAYPLVPAHAFTPPSPASAPSSNQPPFRSLHLCEAPGAFVCALNHFLNAWTVDTGPGPASHAPAAGLAYDPGPSSPTTAPAYHKHHEQSHATRRPHVSPPGGPADARVSESRARASRWQWHASSLNPWHEANDAQHAMIDEDRFIIETSERWLFGLDDTGDITRDYNIRDMWAKLNTHDLAVPRSNSNSGSGSASGSGLDAGGGSISDPGNSGDSGFPRLFALGIEAKAPPASLVPPPLVAGCVDLVTADGSVDCARDPAEQEAATALLHYCEAVCALGALLPGGSLVMKMFTLFEESSVGLLYLFACLFTSMAVCKPNMSKAGNSEVYVVCVGFRGVSPRLLTTLLAPLGPVSPSGSGPGCPSGSGLGCPSGSGLGSTSAVDPAPFVLFGLDRIPECFLEQVRLCAALFAGCSAAVIERNMALWGTCDGAALADKHSAHRRAVAAEFLRRYELRPLAPDRWLVPGRAQHRRLLRNRVKAKNTARKRERKRRRVEDSGSGGNGSPARDPSLDAGSASGSVSSGLPDDSSQPATGVGAGVDSDLLSAQVAEPAPIDIASVPVAEHGFSGLGPLRTACFLDRSDCKQSQVSPSACSDSGPGNRAIAGSGSGSGSGLTNASLIPESSWIRIGARAAKLRHSAFCDHESLRLLLQAQAAGSRRSSPGSAPALSAGAGSDVEDSMSLAVELKQLDARVQWRRLLPPSAAHSRRAQPVVYIPIPVQPRSADGPLAGASSLRDQAGFLAFAKAASVDASHIVTLEPGLSVRDDLRSSCAFAFLEPRPQPTDPFLALGWAQDWAQQCSVAVEALAAGGSLLCSVPHLLDRLSVGVLALMHRCFARLALVQPESRSPTSRHRAYLLCLGFCPGPEADAIRRHLSQVCQRFALLDKPSVGPGLGQRRAGAESESGTGEDRRMDTPAVTVVEVVPMRVLASLADSRFRLFAKDVNTRLVFRQLALARAASHEMTRLELSA